MVHLLYGDREEMNVSIKSRFIASWGNAMVFATTLTAKHHIEILL